MGLSSLLQRIRSTVDEKEQKELLMDLEVVMKSNDCPYIVQFYGAIFKEVSLDTFFEVRYTIVNHYCVKIHIGALCALHESREKRINSVAITGLSSYYNEADALDDESPVVGKFY